MTILCDDHPPLAVAPPGPPAPPAGALGAHRTGRVPRGGSSAGRLADLLAVLATVVAVTWLPLLGRVVHTVRAVTAGALHSPTLGPLGVAVQLIVVGEAIVVGFAGVRHLRSRPGPGGPARRPASALTLRRLGLSAGALVAVAAAAAAAATGDRPAGAVLPVLVAGAIAAGCISGRVGRLAHRTGRASVARSVREAYLEDLVARSSDAILVLDRDGTVVDAVSSVFDLTGLERHEIVGRNAASLLHADDLEKCRLALRRTLSGTGAVTIDEFRVLRADGSITWLNVTMTNRTDAPVGGIVAAFHDITARKRAETELARRALHDGLTGLANRVLFADRLNHSLQRRDVRQAVMYLDLDRFKVVNDSLGHAAGDRLLATVAGRLAAAVRDADTVARLGGDEFAILVETASADPGFGATVADLARRILTSVGRAVDVGGTVVVPATSIGVAFAEPSDAADDVLRHADLALYAAKARGRNQLAVFDAAMQSAASLRLRLETDLRRALRSGSGELGVRFQPVVELGTGTLRGFEALARWQHPTLGTIAPGEFIPIAEESGLIGEVGARVLDTACRVAARCNAERPTDAALAVSVNVAAAQLVDPAFPAAVHHSLTRAGLAAGALRIEVTEDALVRYPDAAGACLGRLRRLGVGVAIDDFGTGRSSLGCLHHFPIDTVKIDQSLFEPRDDGELAAIVRGLLELTTTMGLTAVAEGIESADQVERLVRAGCPLGQGHLFAPALDPAAAVAHARWRVPMSGHDRQGPRAA